MNLDVSMAVLGFNFPPDSGEKVTLEITVLMSLTMFMNMVNNAPFHYTFISLIAGVRHAAPQQ